MAKWVLSFGDDLVRGVGKTISSAGEGVIKGIGKWFAGKGATKAVETEEIIAKQSDQIIEQMAKTFQSTKGVSEDLLFGIKESKKEATNIIDNVAKSIASAKYDKATTDVLFKNLSDLRKLVDEDPHAAIVFLDGNKKFISDIDKLPVVAGIEDAKTSLNSVRKILFESVERLDKILKNDDSALSNVAFINKFLELSKGGMSKQKELWVANPKNFNRLQKLLNPNDGWLFKNKAFKESIIGDKTFQDAIKKDMTFPAEKVKIRYSLRGLTPWEKAKNIGIGYPATAAATVTGAMAVFEWFDEHDPKEMSNEAGSLYSSLDSFNAGRKGKIIVNNTKMSLNKINALGVKLEGELKSEPDATVISNCMGNLNKELLNTQTNLSEWGTVIENSDNKEAAENAGIKIKNFVNELNKNLHELGEKIGIDVSYSPMSLEKGIANRGESDITKIQKFLISRGIAIGLGGKMDWQTINGLKELERMLSVATGNSYTNIFVNLANQNKLEYKDLVEISKAIK